MKIILKGKPLTTNRIYKSVCRGNFPKVYLSNEGKSLKESYQWQAKQQWGHEEPLKGRLKVTIITYHGMNGKKDWDNFHKLSMDALSGIVYEDDSQIYFATVMKAYDKKDPRIEIEIEELL